MSTTSPTPGWRCGALQTLLALWLVLAAGMAWAQADPPGRVGRLADFNGSVSWWDLETGRWADAERNRPLTGGDRISTATSGRAELRIGSTVLRLSNNTELEVLRLDDERMAFELHSGSLALLVRSRDVAAEIELITAETRLLPQRAGHYRVDRNDDTTLAGTWRGELRVDERGGYVVGPGQRVELYRQGRRQEVGELHQAWVTMPGDGFSEWVTSEDRRDERSASSRYVSPEMTGVEDLDRHGRWEQHPEFGALWLPMNVRDDWAPYRYGRWGWVSPWGWTWIDEAPWGFAPFHYGRWVSWHGRWGWVPGAYVQRPVYAPALVAWVGGAQWGISVQTGGPTVGWVPLAPREVFRPHYRSTPVYVERVNPTPRYRWHHAPNHVPTGPIMYGNQGVPNAVTVVPSDVLVRRQPVSRGVVIEAPRGARQEPLAGLPPPPAPVFMLPQPWRRGAPERTVTPVPSAPVQMVPGGAQRPPMPERDVRPVPPDRRDERRHDERGDSRDGRREGRPEGRPESRPEGRPEARPESRPDNRREERREERREDRREDRREERRDGVIDLRQQQRLAAPPPGAAPTPVPVQRPMPQPAQQVAPQPTPQPAPQRAPRPSAPPPAAVTAPAPAPAPEAPAPKPTPAAAEAPARAQPAEREPERERPRERNEERRRRGDGDAGRPGDPR